MCAHLNGRVFSYPCFSVLFLSQFVLYELKLENLFWKLFLLTASSFSEKVEKKRGQMTIFLKIIIIGGEHVGRKYSKLAHRPKWQASCPTGCVKSFWTFSSLAPHLAFHSVRFSTMLKELLCVESGGNPFCRKGVRTNVANWKYFLMWSLSYQHRPHLTALFPFVSSRGEKWVL